MSPPRPAWIAYSIRRAERTVIRNLILAGAATAGLIWLFSAGVAHSAEIVTCDARGCSDWHQASQPHRAAPQRTRHSAKVDANGNRIVIGGRPAGCPHAYCGCGLRKYLGIEDRSLDLAWNWARKFPRAHAAPGMAVVWRHHVALIVSMEGPNEATLRDYNSGGGLSRIHVRSIAGAVVVNPSARTAAVLR